MYEHGANPGTTHVVGTEGHLALELPTTGKASTKSDVFTFGALLLEDVSGKRSLSPRQPQRSWFWVIGVWGMWKEGSVLGMVHRELIGGLDEIEVVMVLDLGLMCSNN